MFLSANGYKHSYPVVMEVVGTVSWASQVPIPTRGNDFFFVCFLIYKTNNEFLLHMVNTCKIHLVALTSYC